MQLSSWDPGSGSGALSSLLDLSGPVLRLARWSAMTLVVASPIGSNEHTLLLPNGEKESAYSISNHTNTLTSGTLIDCESNSGQRQNGTPALSWYYWRAPGKGISRQDHRFAILLRCGHAGVTAKD
jgi:hypothetical protein